MTEAHDKENGLYGTQRLFTVMEANAGEDNKTLLDAIIADVNNFATGVPQFDDITMIVVSLNQ